MGREAKSASEVAERPKQYLRAGEAYERALGLDANCAMAAQGLAILLAEDALIQPDVLKGRGVEEELKSKMRAAGAALGVLSRINDSVQDGSTSVNMGHCYFVRNEEEKAIQAVGCALSCGWPGVCIDECIARTREVVMSGCTGRGNRDADRQYEAAENQFKGRNVSNLLYLSRAWYAYATRDSNYSAMGKSLAYAQRVSLSIQPLSI